MSDLLVLVNEKDEEIGVEEKVSAHLGQGKLHRAFSIFLWDEQGRLLLQKRADGKMLWPGYWSNSVCSHPRKGEELVEAAKRRLQQELGGEGKHWRVITSIIYHAPFKDIGSEREFCYIVFADFQGKLHINPEEVSEVRWVRTQDLLNEISDDPEAFTPWFKLELQALSDLNSLPTSV